MIVSLSGQKRVGKDTVADILVSKFKFNKIALADPLRELCSKVFDIPLSTFLSDELKELPFERPLFLNEDHLGHILAIVENEWGFDISKESSILMSEFVGVGFKHPREILQQVGTEIIRGSIDDNIFLKLADKRIERFGGNVVVSDVRFKLEQEWAKNKGALMCLIKRPVPYLKQDLHRSENELDNEDNFNVIMNNDVHLMRFQIEVTEYFNELMRKRSN